MQRTDPTQSFVSILNFVPHQEIPALIAQADIFVFASSVETFGITLLEAMAVGMPIACSNRSSLPETLQDGGVYFDPQNIESIADAIEQLILSDALRKKLADRAKQLAEPYCWERCAAKTWRYVADTYQLVSSVD
jgi:glycosyltransferase involved in cell wall biosynthesis